MGFDDYPMLPDDPRSYIGSQEVLGYIKEYAQRFNVDQQIKFRHYVIRVRPVQDSKWEVCFTVFQYFAFSSTT